MNEIVVYATVWFNYYAELTKSNQFLSAVVFGGLMTGIYSWFKTGLNNTYCRLKGFLFINLSLEYNMAAAASDRREFAFNRAMYLLSTQSREFVSSHQFTPNLRAFLRDVIYITPMTYGYGLHYIIFNGKLCKLTVGRDGSTVTMELVTLAWNKSVFEDFCKQLATRTEDNLLTTYTNARSMWEDRNDDLRGEDWVYTKHREPIYANIAKWLERSEKGDFNGLPSKLTYLLYGPPGTGKSSLIACTASKFRLDIYNLRLGAMTESECASLIAGIPKGQIVVIEDAKLYDNDADTMKDKVTTSTLLNILEGTGGLRDCIVFITTNEPEKFDARFNQAGRIGHRIELNHWDSEELEMFLNKHYPNHDGKLVRGVANRTLCLAEPWSTLCVFSPAMAAVAASDNIGDYEGFISQLGLADVLSAVQ